MYVAIIPARGGSKRIPRKNIKPFYGLPMIAWSIATAKLSGVFERILVSTDDPEIAEIAIKWGAETPFLRPGELANDYAGTTEVVAHAAHWLRQEGLAPTALCCIYATAPFLQAEDLKAGLDGLLSGNWEYAFSVTDYAAPIFRSFEINADGGVQMFFPEHFQTRSQDLPRAFHDAAQFYWGLTEAWLAQKRVFEPYSLPIIIPRWRVQDIDHLDDWQRAELLAPLLLSKNPISQV